jgi:tetratricopeptide (TPR) repeat protein
MSRDDWYRNKTWDASIESVFRARLARSRSSRPQYLRIQASYLTAEYPASALALIDEYFETGDEFDVPNAFCARAEAYRALGRENDAVSAYKQALEWEVSHPQHISTARIDLPKVVVDNRLANEYDYALDILTSRFTESDHQFPGTRYLWNGCCALITYDLGQTDEAREFAERALRAAGETESPFRYHRSVGVVRDTSDEFGRRLERIARPSRLHSLFRLIGRT